MCRCRKANTATATEQQRSAGKNRQKRPKARPICASDIQRKPRESTLVSDVLLFWAIGQQRHKRMCNCCAIKGAVTPAKAAKGSRLTIGVAPLLPAGSANGGKGSTAQVLPMSQPNVASRLLHYQRTLTERSPGLLRPQTTSSDNGRRAGSTFAVQHN